MCCLSLSHSTSAHATPHVQAKLGDIMKHTDCHYRLSDGMGSFNYRLLFPLTLPGAELAGSQVLRLEAWDLDLGLDDLLGVVELDLAMALCEFYNGIFD